MSSNAWAGRGGGGGGRGRGGGNGGGNRAPNPNNGGGGGGGHRQPNPSNGNAGPYPPLRAQAPPRQAPPPSGVASVTNNMANLNVSGARGGNEGSSSSSSRSNGASKGRSENGERAAKRGARREQQYDLVLSRDAVCGPGKPTKCGTTGNKIDLVANFFPLSQKPDWHLYNHRVDFRNAAEGGIEEQRTFVKKKLLAQQKAHLGLHIFDGSNLYTINRLPNPLVMASQRLDGVPFELTIVFVGQVEPTDVVYLQFFNIITRKCLQLLEFTQIGRHYYDTRAEVNLGEIGYRLIPGFITNIRQHEERLMMCVEITHKVLREISCLSLLRQYRREEDARQAMTGTVVMTLYNNKTYRVDDVSFNTGPQKTFEYNGANISIADYYQRKYQLTVRDMRQPLLVCKPRARDLHRGDNQDIMLLPEFCYPTGIAEQDRANYNKMNVLSTYLQQNPEMRVASTLGFMRRLRESTLTQNELRSWGLNFQATDLVSIKDGRVLPSETLLFRNPRAPPGKDAVQVKVKDADWTSELRTDSKNVMAAAVNLATSIWVIITPSSVDTNELVNTMLRIGGGMGFVVTRPAEVIQLQNTGVGTYLQALEYAKNTYRELRLIFTVMPPARDTSEVYNAVKRRCLTSYGIHNQCFQSKHLMPNNSRKLMSVVTKLLVQINAKLGGEPWKTMLNFKGPTMIVGFDVYHPGKGRIAGKKSYGAIVASTNRYASRFFSKVSPHESMVEISTMLSVDILECVKAFGKSNTAGQLPSAIVLYRDGVGEGQLNYVYETEVNQIMKALRDYYETLSKPPPKLLFIVVTKKGNARILQRVNRSYDNPPPGTIVDTTITLPERYDFFLVAQQARKGQTVSPTTFNVLHDDIKLSPTEVQTMTYQLCHMYFNWSGTVAVPAVCQYAHKLAFLTGMALDQNRTGAGPAPMVTNNLLPFLYYL